MAIFFHLGIGILILIAWAIFYYHSTWEWIISVFMAGCLLGGGVAVLSAHDLFDFCGYCTRLTFLHGPILLLGCGVIAWCKHFRLRAIASLFLSLGLGLIAYDGFYIEPFQLEVTHYKIPNPKIKRPCRILVVADLQTDHFGEYEKSVIRKIFEEKPDIILWAGDYLQTTWGHFDPLVEEANTFLKSMDYSSLRGSYAVRGNVDWEEKWQTLFADMPVETIVDRKSFNLDDLRITCLNLVESFRTDCKVTQTDKEKFHIVLGHAPNFALGNIQADLLVAGHTHGGQIQLPFWGPIITNARVPHRWACGWTDLPSGAKLFVSRGIGMERATAPRLRFLCRPELAVIDLVPEE